MKKVSKAKRIGCLILIMLLFINISITPVSVQAEIQESSESNVTLDQESAETEDTLIKDNEETEEVPIQENVGSEEVLIQENAKSEDTLIQESNFEKFLFDENLSSEEYQLRKQEFINQITQNTNSFMGNVLNNNILSNEFIEFAVNPSNGRFTMGTTGGNPELSSDNYKLLLYGHSSPRTSYTTININGSSYIYGDTGFLTAPYFDGNSNISEIKFGSVHVKQIVSLVENSSTMRDDVVEIKYVVRNEGTSPSAFGLRIMMDTMLGSNDAAPFRIPIVGDVTTEMEFSGDEIPQYWQAFDSLSNPNVVSYGNFISGAIKPSKVQFTNWSRVYNTPWNYTVSRGSSNGDSAVSIIWYRLLNPGVEETYVTRYGLSELLQDLRPPLSLTVAADSSVQVNHATNNYVPYTITTYVQNTGNAPAYNTVCKLKLPSELEFQDLNDTGVVTLGTLGVGELRKIEKIVYVKTKQGNNRNTSYSIEVTADNCSEKSLSKQVLIPGIESKAIIVIPGISGSRLYTNQTVSTKDYLSEKFQKEKHYFTFNSGHQLWEPYTSTISNNIQAITTRQNKIQSEVMMLLCDENGNSRIDINTDVAGTPGVYGAQDTYLELVNSLERNFEDTGYEVDFFPYDWRLSNKNSALELEQFIHDKGYTEVVLVCHSMGGLVASEYINRSVANKEKVDKLITLGTPYLGAPKALYVFETGNFLDWATNKFCMATPLKEVSGNISGIYQLLPSESYFNLNSTTYVEYYNNNGFWGKAIKEKLNYQRTIDLISNRSWAKTSAGQVKQMLSGAINFYNDLFINNSTHVINTVDAYVIAGYGKDTIMEVREEFNKDGSFNSSDDLTILNGGDGTVPLISANIGGLSPDDRTYYIIEDHTGLVSNNDVLTLVNRIINDDPNTYANTITKEIPTVINGKNWYGGSKQTRVKIKIECPVTLSMIDSSGEPWAYVGNDLIYNEDNDRGTFYTLGTDNDIKMAYLQDMENDILLTGTDEGSMNYTASIIDAGYETSRVVFEKVPLTATTKIYTNTDFEKGIQLELDVDGDGTTDKIILPSKVITGTDIVAEYDDLQATYSNYGLIAKSNILSMSLTGKNLNINSNVLSMGSISMISSNHTISGIVNAPTYLLNGKKQEITKNSLDENLENELQSYVHNNLDLSMKIPNSNTIGKTCFITKYSYTIPNELAVKNNLALTTDKINTTNPSIIYSEGGNITIASKEMNLTGIIYAPNGIVTLTGNNIKFNGIIIADRILINGVNVDIKNELDLTCFETE